MSGLSKYIACSIGASKPVSSLLHTITNWIDVADPQPLADALVTLYRLPADTFLTVRIPGDSTGWYPFRAFTAPSSGTYRFAYTVWPADETRPPNRRVFSSA